MLKSGKSYKMIHIKTKTAVTLVLEGERCEAWGSFPQPFTGWMEKMKSWDWNRNVEHLRGNQSKYFFFCCRHYWQLSRLKVCCFEVYSKIDYKSKNTGRPVSLLSNSTKEADFDEQIQRCSEGNVRFSALVDQFKVKEPFSKKYLHLSDTKSLVT